MLRGLKHKDDGEPWIVSYWHIPGGCDYVNAKAALAFFDSEEHAKAVAKANSAPPEMAFAMSRDEYEKSKAMAKVQGEKS